MALSMFHEAHPDTALEMSVTRRPYSFRGGTPGETATWKWRKGLSVYMGDQVHSQLVQSGLLTDAQAALLHTDPRRAFADPQVAAALHAVSQHTGRPVVADMSEVIRAHERGDDFGWARGRPVSAFDHFAGRRATEGLGALGETCDIRFRFDVDFGWHPVDSQRALIWAGQHGKQEAFVDAMARRHFEEAKSVHSRATLLDAAQEVGLSPDELSAFLASDEESTQAVWRSYRDTVGKHGIHSIPYFVLNGRHTNGGPFRDGSGACHTVRGSASPQEFLAIFERILSEQSRWKELPGPRHQGLQARRKLGTEATSAPPAAVAPPAVKAAAGAMKAGFMVAARPTPKSAAAAIPATAAALIGVRVTLHSLRSKPTLNERHGVCERFDAASGRCVVRLDGTSAPMLLKHDNLRRALDAVPIVAAPSSEQDCRQGDGHNDDDDALAIYGF